MKSHSYVISHIIDDPELKNLAFRTEQQMALESEMIDVCIAWKNTSKRIEKCEVANHSGSMSMGTRDILIQMTIENAAMRFQHEEKFAVLKKIYQARYQPHFDLAQKSANLAEYQTLLDDSLMTNDQVLQHIRQRYFDEKIKKAPAYQEKSPEATISDADSKKANAVFLPTNVALPSTLFSPPQTIPSSSLSPLSSPNQTQRLGLSKFGGSPV